MRLRRLLPLVLVVVLAAAACGTSGAPTEYDDTTAKNYIDGCQVALEEDPQAPEANEVCTCAYTAISADADASTYIPFEEFKELDDQLRDDVNAITDSATGLKVTEIVADCIRQVSSS